MRVSISQLKRIIRETALRENEMGACLLWAQE